jgi:nucleotide-binding universal stress UspA family protein
VLEHIVVAVDETDASRGAIRTALRWAAKADARVTIFNVSGLRPLPALAAAGVSPDRGPDRLPALESIQRWLVPELSREPTWPTPEYVAANGVPSVEIARFADDASADLLVVGRKQRSTTARLLVGDTADAVARRSRVPCLFVPRPLGVPKTLLVALDGTARGLAVRVAARHIADSLNAGLELLTVEPARADEPDEIAPSVPAARTTNLRRALNGDGDALQVRRGDPVAEILREVAATEAPVLAVGYHRGGPPGVLELGSVARRLAHSAPCAVLTIPL